MSCAWSCDCGRVWLADWDSVLNTWRIPEKCPECGMADFISVEEREENNRINARDEEMKDRRLLL